MLDISVRKELNRLKKDAENAEDDRKTWRIVSNVVGTIRDREVLGELPKWSSLRKRVDYVRKRVTTSETSMNVSSRQLLEIPDDCKVEKRIKL